MQLKPGNTAVDRFGVQVAGALSPSLVVGDLDRTLQCLERQLWLPELHQMAMMGEAIQQPGGLTPR